MNARAPLPVLPGILAPDPGPPRPRDLCTDCGVSRSRDPGRCGRACQFIHPRYHRLERQVHGRSRDPGRPDELHFGPFLEMHRARLIPPAPGAQWTGITTRVGARLLETGAVDAVLATASHPSDRWRPHPVLVTEPEGMAACRGMKMGFSPLLSLLDEALDRGFRRLGVIGIPCQVHALRALEPELALDRLYVVGTPCSDNTTTENFHRFLALLSDRPQEVVYLEFRTDFHVELRYRDGEIRTIPFIQLPISQLPGDFMPVTCRSCADYTNALADLTVGYMGGDGEQWLLVRNPRGQELVSSLGSELHLETPGARGDRRGPVRAFLTALRRSDSGLPLRRAPRWARPLIAWAMTRFGPRGLEFARTRVEMKAVEAIVTLRRERARRIPGMIPDHVWRLAEPYGLAPLEGERRQETPARERFTKVDTEATT